MNARTIVGRSLRCFGHVVNLAAQSLLAASDADKKKAQMDLEMSGSLELKKRAKSWIEPGPLGKLHRLVKYVLASSQRREEFAAITGGRDVVEYDKLSEKIPRFSAESRALGR
ncbi:hypothetical protein LTR22_027858 [Elasticomyces elasticus]|nr:hypothetical protein LTR22_027858 [Elasticomyces elasticus]